MFRLIIVPASTGTFWGIVTDAIGVHPAVSLIAGVAVFVAVMVTDSAETY